MPSPKRPDWPPRSAPRLFVGQELASGAQVTLEGNQANYLARVMRVDAGDAVVLCDNLTGEWAARVVSAGKREVVLEPVEHLRPREGVPDFVLCAALLKKPNFDLVLEKATELGVAKIQPVITRRCVADKLNLERARVIVTEAAEQCARTALPEVLEPLRLEALISAWEDDRSLFFADELGGDQAAKSFASRPAPAALLTGPEGGFDDGEREAIRAHRSAIPVSLGPRILRGETAAIAATGLWMAVAGDW